MAPLPAWRRRIGVALLALLLGGCGTLMFPERRGQDSGKLDPNVAVLDATLLLFFIVPGLVAFAVDFTTGAIFLPPGKEDGEGPFWGEGELFRRS